MEDLRTGVRFPPPPPFDSRGYNPCSLIWFIPRFSIYTVEDHFRSGTDWGNYLWLGGPGAG